LGAQNKDLGAKQKMKEGKRNLFWAISQMGLKPNTSKPIAQAQDLLGPVAMLSGIPSSKSNEHFFSLKLF
jgi:hypothetical protein